MKTSSHARGIDPIGLISSAFAVLAFALTSSASVARAQSAYPPASVLAAKWWQWAGEPPFSQSPLADQTGQFAAANQPRAGVWFLAGNEGGVTVRTVTIPAGRALFFPVVNTIDVEDGIALPGGQKVFQVPNPLQTAQGLVQQIIATAFGLSCSVDGTPLPITASNLEQSTAFALPLQADNFFGVPAGIYFPAVDSGYYVLLPPLSSGAHTIHFTGGLTYFGTFFLDVTYNITIQ